MTASRSRASTSRQGSSARCRASSSSARSAASCPFALSPPRALHSLRADRAGRPPRSRPREHQRQPPRVRAGAAVFYGAPSSSRARRGPHRALRRAQSRGRGDDALRGRGGLWATQPASARVPRLLPAVLAAGAAAASLPSLHVFLVITLRVSQVVSGLAITILAGAAGAVRDLASTWDVAAGPVPHQPCMRWTSPVSVTFPCSDHSCSTTTCL